MYVDCTKAGNRQGNRLANAHVNSTISSLDVNGCPRCRLVCQRCCLVVISASCRTRSDPRRVIHAQLGREYDEHRDEQHHHHRQAHTREGGLHGDHAGVGVRDAAWCGPAATDPHRLSTQPPNTHEKALVMSWLIN